MELNYSITKVLACDTVNAGRFNYFRFRKEYNVILGMNLNKHLSSL